MAMTISGRTLYYVGGIRMDHFVGTSALSPTDDTRAVIHVARGGVGIHPLTTTTGAGDISVTWTNATTVWTGAGTGNVFVSISNVGVVGEAGIFSVWGR